MLRFNLRLTRSEPRRWEHRPTLSRFNSGKRDTICVKSEFIYWASVCHWLCVFKGSLPDPHHNTRKVSIVQGQTCRSYIPEQPLKPKASSSRHLASITIATSRHQTTDKKKQTAPELQETRLVECNTPVIHQAKWEGGEGVARTPVAQLRTLRVRYKIPQPKRLTTQGSL